MKRPKITNGRIDLCMECSTYAAEEGGQVNLREMSMAEINVVIAATKTAMVNKGICEGCETKKMQRADTERIVRVSN